MIAMWRWGSRDAPAVLLAHGWGGNAAQMRPFVFPLLQAGYRVIAYDQPAHGVSDGKLTGLPDFADVLAEVAWHHGERRGGDRAFARRRRRCARAGVGKSAFRARSCWSARRPTSSATRAASRAGTGCPSRCARAMQTRDRGALRRALGRPRGPARRAAPRRPGAGDPRPRRPHDALDRTARRSRATGRGARLLSTDGLGHRRILADESVTRAAADFIAGRARSRAPDDALAPLY